MAEEEKTVETVEEVKEEVTDLAKKTVAELKKIASDKNITIPAGAKKADILELLQSDINALNSALGTIEW